MKKEEVAKVLMKIKIVQEWFDDNADREYEVSNEKAQGLINLLEAVDGNEEK